MTQSKELWHPRFGLVMSIVAAEPIPAGQEILVNYNYAVVFAPPWYKDLWFSYVR